jgi:hypothetical protein
MSAGRPGSHETEPEFAFVAQMVDRLRGARAVTFVSADPRAYALVAGARSMRPGAELRLLERGRHFDLLIEHGVAPPPLDATWLERLRWGCRQLLLLGRSGGPGELQQLQALGATVQANGQFALLLPGHRSEPVLRVDDYPTGVRPLLSDLAPIHQVLRAIDDRGLRCHLGIVPALLTPAMLSFLRSLRHMVPVAHGYDHAYPRFSGKLATVDPFNERGTVKSFNEFAADDPTQVRRKLSASRRILEDGLGVAVTGYIPPCNRGDRVTGRALAETGYTHCFSEKRVPGGPLTLVTSDFYARSSAWPGAARPGVVTLHTTWEFDLQREGDSTSLPRLLDDLLRQRDEDRAASAALVQRLGGATG